MIEFITGTMFAGKTTKLIEEANKLQEKVVVKCTNLDLAEKGVLKSRNNTQINCLNYNVTQHKSIVDFMVKHVPNTLSSHLSIFIDEVQFLSQLDVFNLSYLNNDIYIYGLATDYKGKLFTNTHTITAVVDKIKMLSCKCDNDCGELATVNHKINTDINDKKNDEQSEYTPLCFKCHFLSEEYEANGLSEEQCRQNLERLKRVFGGFARY